MKKYFLLTSLLVFFALANAQYTWVNKNPFPQGGFLAGASFVINGMGYVTGGIVSYSPFTLSNQT